jgi:hypothetical protein
VLNPVLTVITITKAVMEDTDFLSPNILQKMNSSLKNVTPIRPEMDNARHLNAKINLIKNIKFLITGNQIIKYFKFFFKIKFSLEI